MKSVHPRLIAAASFVSLGIVSTACASSVAYEGFTNTTPGAALSASNTGGTGWSGSWFPGSNTDNTIASGSLSAPAVSSGAYTLTPAGNMVVMGNDTNVNFADYRTLSVASTANLTTGTYWISYLIQPLATALQSNSYAGLGLMENGTTEEVETGLWNTGTNNGPYNMVTTNGGGSVAITNSSDAVAATVGSTALIVLEVSLGSATNSSDVYMWVNPTTSTNFNTTSSAYESLTGGNFSLDALRISAIHGAEDDLDEINVGTTVYDVIGTPEPATAGLIVAPLVYLAARRKRNAPGRS